MPRRASASVRKRSRNKAAEELAVAVEEDFEDDFEDFEEEDFVDDEPPPVAAAEKKKPAKKKKRIVKKEVPEEEPPEEEPPEEEPPKEEPPKEEPPKEEPPKKAKRKKDPVVKKTASSKKKRGRPKGSGGGIRNMKPLVVFLSETHEDEEGNMEMVYIRQETNGLTTLTDVKNYFKENPPDDGQEILITKLVKEGKMVVPKPKPKMVFS